MARALPAPTAPPLRDARAEQPRVGPYDARVVAHHPEVRSPAGEIADADRDVDDGHAAPGQAHDDLRIEVHAIAEPLALEQRDGRLQRKAAKAAERVLDGAGARVCPDDQLGQASAVQAHT